MNSIHSSRVEKVQTAPVLLVLNVLTEKEETAIFVKVSSKL